MKTEVHMKENGLEVQQMVMVYLKIKMEQFMKVFLFMKVFIFKGFWKDNNYHGKGKLTRPNGDTYEGDWKEDKREGFGIQFYKKSGHKYEGMWKNGNIHGHGTFNYGKNTKYVG